MKKLLTWVEIIINLEYLLLIAPQILEMKNNFVTNLIILVVTMVVINLLFLILLAIWGKIVNRFEKRNKEKYSLYNWLGDPNIYLKIYDKLIKTKPHDHSDFKQNYDEIRNIIRENYRSEEELHALKIHLESRNKSPRLNQVMTGMQSIIIALIIPVALGALNIFTMNKSYWILDSLGFIFLFFLLLIFIDYMCKTIERQNTLLLIVNDMLTSMQKGENI